VSETLDGLIDLRKESPPTQSQSGKKAFGRVYAAVYIIAFFLILFWRVSRMLAVLPLGYMEYYRYSIVDAMLALIFPCVISVYLKLRKDDGAYPGDQASRDILALFLAVSLLYAASIAGAVVLNIHFLAVAQWVFYAATVYLLGALAMNLLFSVLKNETIENFEYTLIPGNTKPGGQGGVLDSEKIRMNFSLKSLYTVKYALGIFPGLLLALGLLLLLSTTIFVVQPHQQAAVYHLGRLGPASIAGEGIHLKFPWPIDRVDIYDVHRVNAIQIGYQSSAGVNNLWNQAHDGGEYMLLLGDGNELIAVNIKVIYRISDLYAYIKTSTNPEAVLSAAAYESLMRRTVTTTLDSFLSVDRSSLSASIAAELSAFCLSEGLGLSITQIVIEGIHPPVDIADVYQRVVTAAADKQTIITNAKTEAEEKRIGAERESKTVISYAMADQYRRVSGAQKEMAVYYAAMEAYTVNPDSYELAKYLETFAKVVYENKVYVFSPGMEDSMERAVVGNMNTLMRATPASIQ
jgi:membrane protease subunit HflK